MPDWPLRDNHEVDIALGVPPDCYGDAVIVLDGLDDDDDDQSSPQMKALARGTRSIIELIARRNLTINQAGAWSTVLWSWS
jgi:hypothetical protein